MTEALYGFKVKAFPTRLAKLLAEEFCKPHSTVRDFNNTRKSITLVRATNRCIRGSRIPVSHMSIRCRLEEGTGLGLELVLDFECQTIFADPSRISSIIDLAE